VDVSTCLDRYSIYICPRANPDGAELALATPPRLIRSSTRAWPHAEPLQDGIDARDMDGDGRVLSMRIPDANGPWKICEREPRLMVRRDPAETGGRYYRLLPEGEIRHYDGVSLPAEKRAENLDLNRNFPASWRGEHQQPGAGAFPASEPEVRALVDFITRHRNICSAISLHSYSGVLLRPLSYAHDDKLPAEDCWMFDQIGRKGTALTGYPMVSAYHDFRYHPQEIITGAMDDWIYEQLGCLSWTVEFWSPQRQAGIDDYHLIEWYRDHPLEDDIKMLKWNDEQLQGRGHVDWYPFEHPQLGPVELGGWDLLYSFWNPPPHKLAAEVEPVTEWLLWHALIHPRLEFGQVSAELIGEELWHVRAVVQNSGWLPTDITRKARQEKMVRELCIELVLSDKAELIRGPACQQAGQLEGWSHKSASPYAFGARIADPSDNLRQAEWVLRAPAGTVLSVQARHERAGRIQSSVCLGELP
jgi:murein tripeptide amidase MpaA